jgi:hypothetical protein
MRIKESSPLGRVSLFWTEIHTPLPPSTFHPIQKTVNTIAITPIQTVSARNRSLRSNVIPALPSGIVEESQCQRVISPGMKGGKRASMVLALLVSLTFAVYHVR